MIYSGITIYSYHHERKVSNISVIFMTDGCHVWLPQFKKGDNTYGREHLPCNGSTTTTLNILFFIRNYCKLSIRCKKNDENLHTLDMQSRVVLSDSCVYILPDMPFGGVLLRSGEIRPYSISRGSFLDWTFKILLEVNWYSKYLEICGRFWWHKHLIILLFIEVYVPSL